MLRAGKGRAPLGSMLTSATPRTASARGRGGTGMSDILKCRPLSAPPSRPLLHRRFQFSNTTMPARHRHLATSAYPPPSSSSASSSAPSPSTSSPFASPTSSASSPSSSSSSLSSSSSTSSFDSVHSKKKTTATSSSATTASGNTSSVGDDHGDPIRVGNLDADDPFDRSSARKRDWNLLLQDVSRVAQGSLLVTHATMRESRGFAPPSQTPNPVAEEEFQEISDDGSFGGSAAEMDANPQVPSDISFSNGTNQEKQRPRGRAQHQPGAASLYYSSLSMASLLLDMMSRPPVLQSIQSERSTEFQNEPSEEFSARNSGAMSSDDSATMQTQSSAVTQSTTPFNILSRDEPGAKTSDSSSTREASSHPQSRATTIPIVESKPAPHPTSPSVSSSPPTITPSSSKSAAPTTASQTITKAQHQETPGPSLSAAAAEGPSTLPRQRVDFFKTQQEHSKQRSVPSSQVSRLWHFGGLAARMGIGAVGEAALRVVGMGHSDTGSAMTSPANIARLTSTLGRMRGAALKLGQMLSIQDSALIPPEIAEILDRVRYAADRMPDRQLESVLSDELGEGWKAKFKEFDTVPIAAASIGQVHRGQPAHTSALGVLHDNREVAVKIQYPGVGKSIASDLRNLGGVLGMLGVLPRGMYIENTLRVAEQELLWETDYVREAEAQMRMKELLRDDAEFYVPDVISELSTGKILTTELIDGRPVDTLVDAEQDVRNKVSAAILRLSLREIFEFRYMQTDPNWANFFYNPFTKKIGLLDFGACREFVKEFTDYYLRVVHSAAENDRQGVLDASRRLKFLTGEETEVMNNAHVEAVMIIGEPFSAGTTTTIYGSSTSDQAISSKQYSRQVQQQQERGSSGRDSLVGPVFDFEKQNVTKRIHDLIPTMLRHRLTPPPTETYSLHRKLSGTFLLCAKLRAKIECRSTFLRIYDNYQFESESS